MLFPIFAKINAIVMPIRTSPSKRKFLYCSFWNKVTTKPITSTVYVILERSRK